MEQQQREMMLLNVPGTALSVRLPMAGVGRFRVENRWFSMNIRGSEDNIVDKPVDVDDNTLETDDIQSAFIHDLDYTIPKMDCRIKNPELLPYIGSVIPTEGAMRILNMILRIVEPMLKDVGGD